MTPDVRQVDAIELVGLASTFRPMFSAAPNAMDVLPPLWEAFLQRQDEVPHRTGPAVYGYMFTPPLRAHPDDMRCLVGVPVHEATAVPSDMEAHTLAAGHYAVVPHVGTSDTLPATITALYRWLDASRFRHTQVADVQYLPDGRRDMRVAVPMEYWVSVERDA